MNSESAESIIQQRLKPQVSVVVPCYNEAETIPIIVDAVTGVFDGLPDVAHELIIVNDGSTDDSRAILETLQSKYATLCPFNLVKNAGQSAALVTGMHAARGDYVLTMDGDMQNDPADFPRVLELLKEYEVVCGYRDNRQDARIRLLSSKVGNCVRNALLRDGLRDSGCGLKGFRRHCVDAIVPFDGAHRFLGVFMRAAGFCITEYPVQHHPRQRGVSKYGVHSRLWRGILDLFGVWWLRKRFVYPVVEQPEQGEEHGATEGAPRAEAVSG